MKEEKTKKKARPKRAYKDSLFTLYFREKPRLLELYNVLSGNTYPLDTSIMINTIMNVLFFGQYNDLSFLINGRLIVLFEHQASWNPNMPFRLLLYIVELYMRMFPDHSTFFSSKLVPIPPVECYVLYNGTDEKLDHSVLKLSDAFHKVEGANPMLELEVHVYNVNNGRNPDIMEKAQSLKEYAAFIACVRTHLAVGKPLDKAIEHAIDECIARNIMSDFLKTHRVEVRNVLFNEVTVEDVIRVRTRDARDEEAQKWQSVLAEKDIVLAEKDAIIAKLRAQIGG